ncbi:MAG: purine nucleoside phosphorylase 1 [Pirellulaceae bacterium]|nr:MAG: purine nucleoside phosphorylase 1 [Pirellulaceae bacterium]
MRFGRSRTADDRTIDQATTLLRQHLAARPEVAIVLGSGLGQLAERFVPSGKLDYRAIPGFPRVTAEGHAGQLVWGNWSGRCVMVLQGRAHLYEGCFPEDLMLPIRVAYRLGVRRLVVTNAAGGLHERLAPGDLMLIRDHISLQWLNGIGWFSGYGERPKACLPIYDPNGIRAAERAGLRCRIRLASGIYVGVTGPNYETRAEYRMLRRIGADAVGMSTICEAVAAAHLGMMTIGISVIANVACPDSPQRLGHDDVLTAMQQAAPAMGDLLEELLAGSDWAE